MMGEEERSRVWIRRIVQLALTAAVTWLVLDQVGITFSDALSIRPAVPEPSALLLLGSVVTLMGGLTISAWLWGRLALELGGRDPGLVGAMRIVFSANLARYLPGRLWQIAGLAVLSGRAGISGAVGGMAGVLGQAFALAAVGVLAAPVLMGPGTSGGRAGAVALGALVLFVALASIPPVLNAVLRLALRIAKVQSVQPPSGRRLFGLRWLGWYLLNWIVYSLAFVLFVHGLGFFVDWAQLVSAFAAAYLLGYVAVFAPAGLGVREGFLIVFLQPELAGAAVGVALLTRLWMTVAELVPAGGFALWEVTRSVPAGRGGLRSGEQ